MDMKRINHILWIISLIIVAFLSCSKDENTAPSSRGETYIIGINLDVETPLTKGVSGGFFNSVYEGSDIYLHKKTGNSTESESIQIPIYEYDCQDPNQTRWCKGFRFEVKHNENGSYTLTPLGQNNERGNSMVVHDTDNFYFSSIGNREWKVNYEKNIDHIQENFVAPEEVTTVKNELYFRDPTVNKEIYRSERDFTLQEVLNLNGDLQMERKCSGYSFMALFTNREPSVQGSRYVLDSSKFLEVMGSSFQEWYIKIYLGNVFTNTYDMQEETGKQEAGGFYGSTDRTTYGEEGIDNGNYLQFRDEIIPGNTIDGDTNYEGIGYQSATNNVLISPTDENKRDDFTAFILIKHWTGGEEGPDEEWLQNNDNAIYTQVTFEDVVRVGIQDGIFYQCAIYIDINELKAAAEEAGILNAPSTTNATKSLASHNNKPKKFTLHNAETFIRY